MTPAPANVGIDATRAPRGPLLAALPLLLLSGARCGALANA